VNKKDRDQLWKKLGPGWIVDGRDDVDSPFKDLVISKDDESYFAIGFSPNTLDLVLTQNYKLAMMSWESAYLHPRKINCHKLPAILMQCMIEVIFVDRTLDFGERGDWTRYA
jgi:hypothetical protein